jgi:hypothetical protein
MNDPGELIQPTRWTDQHLEEDRLQSADRFRRERMREPLEEYLDRFDAIRSVIETLMEETVDLRQLREKAVDILTDPEHLEIFRYLAGPPISLDDLKTLVDTNSLAPSTIRNNPELVDKLVDTIRDGLDRGRFPWINPPREPDEDEIKAAVVASAALMATQKVATRRRNEGKERQERQVREALRDVGFEEIDIPGRIIRNIAGAPPPGRFSREVKFGERKADLVVGLWDQRIMAIECKVSNSSINSVKRLNNDAAIKAENWRRDFGALNVVPVAVLSGVYKLRNLQQAQNQHLTLYWAHRLSDLTDWIARTRPQ